MAAIAAPEAARDRAAGDANLAACAHYAQSVRPLVEHSHQVYNGWVETLRATSRIIETAAVHAHEELVGAATLSHSELVAVRKRLATLPVPGPYRATHKRIDAWLARLVGVCGHAKALPSPLTREALGRLADQMKAVTRAAESFNTERAATEQRIADTHQRQRATSTGTRRARPAIAKLAVFGAPVVMLAILAAAWYVIAGPGAAWFEAPTPRPAGVAPEVFIGKRTFSRADIQERLVLEIDKRGIKFTIVDLRLRGPDTAVISGSVPIPGGTLAIDIDAAIAATPNGSVAVTPRSIAAGGVAAPPFIADALNKRIGEASAEMGRMLAGKVRVASVTVTSESVTIETEAIG